MKAPKAGYELDARVAEKVMGDDMGHVHQWVHHVPPDDGYGGSLGGWYCSVCEPEGYTGLLRLTDPRTDARSYEVRYTPRPYSTDIAHAWKVVDRLRATGTHGWHVRLDTEDHDEWSCMVWNDPEDNPIGIGRAANPALAICHAALAAIAEVAR